MKRARTGVERHPVDAPDRLARPSYAALPLPTVGNTAIARAALSRPDYLLPARAASIQWWWGNAMVSGAYLTGSVAGVSIADETAQAIENAEDTPGPDAAESIPDQKEQFEAIDHTEPYPASANGADPPVKPAQEEEQAKLEAGAEAKSAEETDKKSDENAEKTKVAEDTAAGETTDALPKDKPVSGGTAGGGGGGTNLSAWKARVSSATAAAPKPTLGDTGSRSAKRVVVSARKAGSQLKGKRSSLVKSAKAARKKAPDPGKPLPAPPPSPVPAADRSITEASNKTLPKQTLPSIKQRPAGTPKGFDKAGSMPTLDANLATDIGTAVSVKPPEKDGQTGPPDSKNPNKKAVDKVKDAAKKGPDEGKRAKAGDVLVLQDVAPKPSPGGEVGTKGISRQKMAGVLAELKKHSAPEADRIVTEARKESYPGQSLQIQYKTLGNEDLKPQVKTEIENKVDSLRKVAGLSAADIDKAMETRKAALKKDKKAAKSEIDQAVKGSKKQLKKDAETHADETASAHNAVDTDTIQQLTAAGGDVDPEVIKLRRDQAVRNLARRAARQDVYYEQSGERRQKALNAMAKRYSNAYANAAQRDHANHIDTLKKTLEKEGKSKADAAKQAGEQAKTETAPIFKWAARQHREASSTIAQLLTAADNTIKRFRKNVKDALTAAREMVRDWARKKIAEQESWWDKFLNLFKDWAQDAQDDSAAWEEARNQALRDKVVGDFTLLDDIQAAAQSGVDTKTYIAERGLDETQAMILQKYYAGAGKKGFKPDAIGAVAYGMRMRVRAEKKPKFIETMKSRVMAKEDGEWRKLARIGDAERPPFDVVSMASDLHKAMDQWGTDEPLIYRSIGSLTPLQAKVLRAHYHLKYKISLDQHLAEELSGSEKTRAMALLEGNQTLADVATLHEAMHGGLTGAGTDEDTIMRVLRGKTKEERDAIIAEYERTYGLDLNKDLKSELDDGWSSHHDHDRASALLAGDTAKADAIGLDQAMHGGWTGAGTDEAQITQVYEQTRSEVEAEAAANGWSTEQMNAEIARRNKAIEDAYEGKYGDKKKDGDDKSALKKALEGELSDSELDLAMALADNNVVKADIARLEVERTSFVTDDDVVVKVLESQRTRAEKDVKRDAEYDLHLRADMDLMRGIPWDQKKWSSERKLSKAQVEKDIKARSKLYMSNLENEYDAKYSRFGKGGLQVLIAFNMSGNEATKARDLIATGGLLEPSREIFYAVNGVGTDVDELKRILKDKSPDQIRELEAEWARLYPGEPPLKERIFDEVGGRDHQDMKWALQGEPQTREEKIKRAKERMEYEKSAYWLGSSFSEKEQAFMEDEYEHLVAEKKRLDAFESMVKKPVRKSGENEEDFAIRMEEFKAEQAFWKRSFELQEGYFDRTVEDHRAAVDELADTASTVAAIIATVVVIVVASIFTGGTAGAAIIAALASAKVAAAAAAAAAVATIATKQLLKGSAYSNEDMAVDAVVGVVDAAASYLTAGMGGALLKTARQGAKVSRLTALVGRSKAATHLAKAAASNKTSTRVFANALAEGIEGVASTLPSALAGNTLREENWVKGNPLTNILTGTLIETSIGVGLSGGLGGLGGLGKHADDVADAIPSNRDALTDQLAESGDVLARRGTPAERLAKFQDWEIKNPGKTYDNFLQELDAGLIAKEVNETTIKAAQRNMRSELLSAIPPAQRGEFAEVPIDIMADADFYRFTKSKSAKAVVIFEDGKPRVILREGADPSVLREEGIHLLQSKDPKFAKKIAQLDETRLANWNNLDLEEQFRLYRNKLDIEIDAQKRLLKSLDDQIAGIDDPALRKTLLARRDAAKVNLDNLATRLDEVDSFTPFDRLRISRGELNVPQYLDQKPRLFSKLRDLEQEALTQVPKRKQVRTRKLSSELGGDFDDSDRLSAFAKSATDYDSKVKTGRIGQPSVVGSVRARAYLFVNQMIHMAGESKTKAKGMLTSFLDFFDSVNVSVVAPFLHSAPAIYKAYRRLATISDTLFDNLQKIATSGTFGPTKLSKISDALDHILDSSDPKRFDQADAFVRDIREAVDEWNGLQKQLSEIKEMAKSNAQDEAVRLAKKAANAIEEEFGKKLAKLDGYHISDTKLLDDLKTEIKNIGRWDWKIFREQLGVDLAGPSNFAALEDIIEGLRRSGSWEAGDIGPVRRWANVIEKLHESLEGAPTGPKLQAFFDSLKDRRSPFRKFFIGEGAPDLTTGTPQQKLLVALGHMLGQFEKGYKLGSYEKLRYFIRDAVIASMMDNTTPSAKLAFIRNFLTELRKFDSASVGEYFSAFRRAILESDDNLPARGMFKGVRNIGDAPRVLEGGTKMADGAVKITQPLSDQGPFPGRYLVEDKAGKSFDPKQAERYSNFLKARIPPSIRTQGIDNQGIIYFFEDVGEAAKKLKYFDDNDFHGNIHVATFGPDGELQLLPRKIKPPRPDVPDIDVFN